MDLLAKIPPKFWIFIGSLNMVTIFVGIQVSNLLLTVLGLFNILCCGISYQITKKK
jgi:hypothetical protein